METFRGGLLFMVRWLFHYPIVLGTYRLRNWTRAPFLMRLDLQGKPGILVSNYGNYFYDDIIGMMVGPVWPFFFLSAALLRIPLFGYFLKFFRALPIVRTGDRTCTPEQRVALNAATFEKASSLLQRGHWFAVFPEVAPGHRSTLAPKLKPGVAHIALHAAESAGWGLGLHIYVYGTNYENKFAGRSNVWIRWAQPIEVARYKDAYQRDPRQTELDLMQDIEKALHSAVLEAPTLEELGDAHRLAYQRKDFTFSGIQNALYEVTEGSAAPAELRRLVCRRRNESVLYQILAYVLLAVGWSVGWPFRVFGRLCASERSQEMTYRFMLWLLVLITGILASKATWCLILIVFGWAAMKIWLWAWRRGIVDESTDGPFAERLPTLR